MAGEIPANTIVGDTARLPAYARLDAPSGLPRVNLNPEGRKMGMQLKGARRHLAVQDAALDMQQLHSGR